MDVLLALDRAKATDWIDEDGERLDVVFLPGLSEKRLVELEARVGAPLPEDYRALGLECAGIKIDFEGFEEYWVEEIVPHGIPFAHDGCGNYWVVDCLREREARSHIFYACHDAPVLLYQGTGLAGFLDALPAFDRGDHDSPIWRVWSEGAFRVWNENPSLLSQTEVLTSSDPVLRAFAEEIGEPCWIADLRNVPVGMGFSWGRYGIDTRLRRHGEERIFACAQRERRPGLVRRLLGQD